MIRDIISLRTFTVKECKLQTIATLGPNVRLVVAQFHMKRGRVPLVIPAYSDFHKVSNQISGKNGVRVMEPTPDVLLEFFTNSDYQLVDAWTAPHENDGGYSEVRYVFCNPEQVNPTGLRPDFIAQRDTILDSFNGLINKNLWKTMGHLNPFFVHGQRTDQKVLMFDCNSRKETVQTIEEIEKPVRVFQGGRDKLTRQGVGPLVPLTDKAHRLKLVGDEVVLEAPEQISIPSPVL